MSDVSKQYLQDAISQLDRSFGDVRSPEYAEHMRTMAGVSALISIAASLENIASDLHDWKITYQEADDRGSSTNLYKR